LRMKLRQLVEEQQSPGRLQEQLGNIIQLSWIKANIVSQTILWPCCPTPYG
jgi:hypothetical protein